MQKALYEEKRHSSWVDPDERWDRSVAHFCHAIYENERFMSDFEPFAQEVTAAGERAAAGQLVLRLTSPGVPDTYNGDELWYLALVDPDNRRPVDFDRARDLLAGLAVGGAPARETIKLFILWTAPRVARATPRGVLRALRAACLRRGHVCVPTWRRHRRGGADPRGRARVRRASRALAQRSCRHRARGSAAIGRASSSAGDPPLGQRRPSVDHGERLGEVRDLEDLPNCALRPNHDGHRDLRVQRGARRRLDERVESGGVEEADARRGRSRRAPCRRVFARWPARAPVPWSCPSRRRLPPASVEPVAVGRTAKGWGSGFDMAEVGDGGRD